MLVCFRAGHRHFHFFLHVISHMYTYFKSNHWFMYIHWFIKVDLKMGFNPVEIGHFDWENDGKA